MSLMKPYLLRIICAALLCALAQRFTVQNDVKSNLIKFVSGIIMLLVVLSPFQNLEIKGISNIYGTYASEAARVAEQGKAAAREELCDVISNQVQTYILDKAEQMDADVCVKIALSEEDIPKPIQASISGNISPYAKNKLQEILEKDLGITRENQIWN